MTDDEPSIDDVEGVDDEIAAALRDAGYDSLADVRAVSQSDLYGIDGVDAALASKLVGAAKKAEDESTSNDTGETQTADPSADGGSVESETADDEVDADESSEADEETDDEEASVSDDTDEETEAGDESASDETETESEVQQEESGDGNESEDETSASAGLVEVRQNVQQTAAPLIGHELDGVIEVTKIDEGWRAVVEMVERHSVPDTQDILGQYELDMDDDGTVVGYRRVSRYRRNEGAPESF